MGFCQLTSRFILRGEDTNACIFGEETDGSFVWFFSNDDGWMDGPRVHIIITLADVFVWQVVMTEEQLEALRRQISVYATICQQLVEMHKASLSKEISAPGQYHLNKGPPFFTCTSFD